MTGHLYALINVSLKTQPISIYWTGGQVNPRLLWVVVTIAKYIINSKINKLNKFLLPIQS
jgi:hypothetical protein